MTRGVIIGCDEAQEWLLPWWWSHYAKQSGYPVAFIDFGMSREARSWCAQRGKVIALDAPKEFVFPRSLIDKELVAEWEKSFGEGFWKGREQWFRKPFALLLAPFEETIWLDLDCEVIGPLAPLFTKIHASSKIALAPERRAGAEEPSYNTGVIVFQKEAPLIGKWAESCHQANDRFFADRDVLTFLINSENIEVADLSESYNWQFSSGVNLDAAILHWSGAWGKQVLSKALSRQKNPIG